MLAFRARQWRNAGPNGLSVEVHRACTAQRHPAAEFCARHFERIPQDPQQGGRGVDVDLHWFSIYEKACHVESTSAVLEYRLGVLVWMELPRVMLQLFGEACSSTGG